MKKISAGIVRDLDTQGRIVIPKSFRIAINMHEGDSVEIFTDEAQIICRKYQPGCVFCDSTDDIREVRGIRVCRKCAREIARRDYYHMTK